MSISGRFGILVFCFVATLGGAGQAGAQVKGPTRIQAVVEYISGTSFYLAAGTGAGILAGDTLEVARMDRTGRIRVIGSGADRASVTFVGAAFPVTVGDSVTILIPDRTPDAPRQAAAPEPAQRGSGTTRVPRTATSSKRARPPMPMRIDGTIAFEFDAMDSQTEWGSLPEERETRRFRTPGVRLVATASRLPGGLRVTTNLRYEQRYMDGIAVEGVSSLRLYTASVSRDFSMFRFEAGRFFNSADLYGGYWDGGLVRVGSRRFGVGASAGYSPDRVNGGFRSNAPKISVFTDYTLGGDRAAWRAAIVAHGERDSIGVVTRWLSVNQSVRFGGAILSNRTRLDAGTGSDWSVGLFDASLRLPLIGDLSARASYARRSYTWAGLEPDTTRPHNARRSVGLQYSSNYVSASIDGRDVEWSDGERSHTISTSLSVRQELIGIGFGATASRADRAGETTNWLSPWLSRSFGPVTTMLSYQAYGSPDAEEAANQGLAFNISFPLAGGLRSAMRFQLREGSGTSSTRLFTSVWKSF